MFVNNFCSALTKTVIMWTLKSIKFITSEVKLSSFR